MEFPSHKRTHSVAFDDDHDEELLSGEAKTELVSVKRPPLVEPANHGSAEREPPQEELGKDAGGMSAFRSCIQPASSYEERSDDEEYLRKDSDDDVMEDDDKEESSETDMEDIESESLHADLKSTCCKESIATLSSHVFSTANLQSPLGGEDIDAPSGEKWHTIDSEDEEPLIPDFCPPHEPGFRLPSADCTWTPLEIFLQFFTWELMSTLCSNIVALLEEKKRKEEVRKSLVLPKHFGPAYFLRFISVILYMGLCKMPAVEDYFRRGLFSHNVMLKLGIGRDLFRTIMRFLHFSSIEEERSELEKKAHGEPYNKLIKVSSLLEHIKKCSQNLMAPGRHLSLDERILASKTRFTSFKTFNPRKPQKWGFKLWVLACPRTGYTHNFSVYLGKQKLSENEGKGVTHSAVLNLLKDYLNRGHIIFMDSFYTSQELLLDLYNKGTFCVGTVSESRHGYPSTKTNALDSRSQRGDIRWCRQGRVVYIQWMDMRKVTVASTCHKGNATCTTHRFVRSGKSIDGTNSILITQPSAFSDYNKNMRGVDLSDQLLQYETVRKCKKWYKKFFFHCIDIASTNSYIIHRELAKKTGEKALRHKEFIEKLIREILEIPLQFQPGLLMLPPPSPPPVTVVTSSHCLVYFGKKRTCVFCSKRSRIIRTRFWCEICGVSLCGKKRQCFQKYHEKHGLM